jgi:hypothetical protein
MVCILVEIKTERVPNAIYNVTATRTSSAVPSLIEIWSLEQIDGLDGTNRTLLIFLTGIKIQFNKNFVNLNLFVFILLDTEI